jgi:hypothetical protein
VGPDGAFYFVNYAGYRDFTSKTGIVRIVYNGSCVSTSINAHAKPEWVERSVQVSGSAILVTAAGRHALQVKDLSGRLIAEYAGQGPAKYDLGGIMKSGVCVATLTTGQGSFAWKMIR